MAGKIEVITGCMSAGKSSELVRRVKREAFAKREVETFKYQPGEQTEISEIVADNRNISIIAHAIPDAIMIVIILGQQERTDLPVIAIDEAHLFGSSLVPVVQGLANEGARVIVSGLDQDFRGEAYPHMGELMAIADEVTKLKAVCTICGESATRTQRLVNGEPAKRDDPVVLAGDGVTYEPRCREHHEVPEKPTDYWD